MCEILYFITCEPIVAHLFDNKTAQFVDLAYITKHSKLLPLVRTLDRVEQLGVGHRKFITLYEYHSKDSRLLHKYKRLRQDLSNFEQALIKRLNA